MKKIINGKVYDTDTAKELGCYSNGGGWRDFSHYEETLYRKKTGEYFLYGEGGPMTRYAEAQGQNQWSGGSRIMPMTYDEAAKWAEENLTAEEYEEIFGEVVEDDSQVVVTYRLSASTAERIRRMADRDGISQAALIERLVARRSDGWEAEIVSAYNAAVRRMAEAEPKIDDGDERADRDHTFALGEQSGISRAVEALGYRLIRNDEDYAVSVERDS